MSKTKHNSKRSVNDGSSEDNSDIEMGKDKSKKERVDKRERTANRKDRTDSDSDSDSSDSSSRSSGSSSSTSSSSVASASANTKDKIKKTSEKTSEKSKIPSKPNDRKNDIALKREKVIETGNRSKWDSPEQRRRSRSPRRERSQGRYEEREKYAKRAESNSRDRYQDRERRKFHDDRKRNDNRGDDRRGYRNREEERYRQRPDRSRDVDRRDRASDANEGGDRRSGDGWRNSRNDYERTRNIQRRDRSRSPRRDRRSPKQQERRNRRSRSFEKDYKWGKNTDEEKKHTKKPEEKEQPNFGLSGALTEDTNKVNGVVVKYAEPPEARRPKRRWRLYPFKGETALPVLHIHRQSCFLVGRDRKVVDLAVDHPSCSKQHAALQYRLVSFKREDGTQGKRVRLYIIDLDSANGTFLNNKPIEARKYYELFEKDVIKFGFSTREYVLLHENSKEDQEDDDVSIKQEPADE